MLGCVLVISNVIFMIQSEQAKRDKKIIDAYLKGEEIRIIAAFNGLTTQGIRHILKKYGYKASERLDKKN